MRWLRIGVFRRTWYVRRKVLVLICVRVLLCRLRTSGMGRPVLGTWVMGRTWTCRVRALRRWILWGTRMRNRMWTIRRLRPWVRTWIGRWRRRFARRSLLRLNRMTLWRSNRRRLLARTAFDTWKGERYAWMDVILPQTIPPQSAVRVKLLVRFCR